MTQLQAFPQVKTYDRVESGVGREGQFFFNEEIDPGSPALPPTHQASINGGVKTARRISAKCARDSDTAVAAVKTGQVASQLAVNDLLKVGGVLYKMIANGGSPVGHQIALGTNAAGTAAAINTKLHADTAAGILCDTTVSTDTITATANTAGIDFDFWCSNPNFVIVTSTANVSDRGYIDIKLNKKGSLNPTVNTGLKINIGLTIANIFTDLALGAYVPATHLGISGTPDLYDITLTSKAVLAAALAGTSTVSAGGYTDGNDAVSQGNDKISAAMQLLFGSDPNLAFQTFSKSALGDTLRIQLGQAGADCVNTEIACECTYSAPDEILVNQFRQPIGKGWRHGGTGGKIDASGKTNLVKVQTGNSTAAQVFASVVDFGASLEIVSYLTPELEALYSRYKIAISNGVKHILLGSASNVDVNQGVRFLFTYEDKEDTTSYLLLHAVVVVDYKQVWDITASPAVQLTLTPLPFSGRGDRFGVQGTARIVAA